MQTKCSNLIPLLEIPLYIDSDHLNVLLVSLKRKKKPHQTKKPTNTPTRCLIGPQQETYLLKQKSRKEKLQVLHNFIHLNCLQFGKFFFVRFQFFTYRVNHVTHNILRFGIQHH